MKVVLLRNEDCHIWPTAEAALKEALTKAGFPPNYEVVVVKDKDEAQKYRFFGSPQVTIDGVDIDTGAAKATQFQVQGCRFYMWQGKMSEYPPVEMILSALKGHV